MNTTFEPAYRYVCVEDTVGYRGPLRTTPVMKKRGPECFVLTSEFETPEQAIVAAQAFLDRHGDTSIHRVLIERIDVPLVVTLSGRKAAKARKTSANVQQRPETPADGPE